jgi:hypothetical protein
MYKFSNEAKHKFFSNPTMSFLFHYFYANGRLDFIINKRKEKNKVGQVESLELCLHELNLEAVRSF